MNNAITASNLSCANIGQKHPAITGLSFTIFEGEIVCLAGVNGSGKSTLLYTLAGLFPAVAGTLSIFDEQRTQQLPANNPTALMVQEAEMQLLGATVEEDMLLSLEVAVKENNEIFDASIAYAMAETFGLADQWQTPVQKLSYGQKRKLCLAGAILRAPRLLLLDEPLSGLDYPSIKELRCIIATFASQGITVVFSSHDLEALMEHTDKYLFLSPEGGMVFGTAAQTFPHAEAFGIRLPPLNTP